MREGLNSSECVLVGWLGLMIAINLFTLILVIYDGSSWAGKESRVVEMVRAGADPIKARCALDEHIKSIYWDAACSGNITRKGVDPR